MFWFFSFDRSPKRGDLVPVCVHLSIHLCNIIQKNIENSAFLQHSKESRGILGQDRAQERAQKRAQERAQESSREGAKERELKRELK